MKKRWSAAEIFEHACDLEEKDRLRRGLERRMQRSRLEKFKPIADFDWNWPSSIDRPLVESLLDLGFLDGARNVVLVGTALSSPDALSSFCPPPSSRSISPRRKGARALERRLRYFAKVGLLVIDELGFLAFDNQNADLIFEVVSRRYEKKSTILKTNLKRA